MYMHIELCTTTTSLRIQNAQKKYKIKVAFGIECVIGDLKYYEDDFPVHVFGRDVIARVSQHP